MDEEKKEITYEELTEKQKRFIDYYIETANATESAKQAGYSENSAAEQGYQNYIKLQRFIKERLEAKAKTRIASQDEVLEYLTRVMRGDEKDVFELDASLQDRTKAAELLGKRYATFTDKVQEDKSVIVKFNVPRPTGDTK